MKLSRPSAYQATNMMRSLMVSIGEQMTPMMLSGATFALGSSCVLKLTLSTSWLGFEIYTEID